jgi:hypothetical protein
MYSFEETVKLTSRISEEFGPWANYECKTMKQTLVKWDVHATGRVPLSKFWRHHTPQPEDGEDTPILYESSAYLRTLGVIDDSNSSLGPQVIIPNYVYSTANCVLTNSLYSTCCLNACDHMVQQLESRFQAPVASVEDILKAVREMPSSFNGIQALNGTLEEKLLQIAAQNGDGVVPIHGRLFAQWLHYVFPHDCPYPHESVMQMTPDEWAKAVGFNESDPEAVHPSVAEDHELHNLQQQAESLLPPAPNAGWNMWVAKENLLMSETASDGWAAWAGVFLQSLICMSFATVLLAVVLKSIRHLQKVMSEPETLLVKI